MNDITPKYAVIAAAAAAVVCMALAVFFLTDPSSAPDLSMLNYLNQASVAAQTDTVASSITPETDKYGDGDTIFGSVDGKSLADYLYSREWRILRIPPISRHREGAGIVRFNIGEYDRIVVYEGRRIACVSFGDDSRWYKTDKDDYDDAAQLLELGKVSIAINGAERTGYFYREAPGLGNSSLSSTFGSPWGIDLRYFIWDGGFAVFEQDSHYPTRVFETGWAWEEISSEEWNEMFSRERGWMTVPDISGYGRAERAEIASGIWLLRLDGRLIVYTSMTTVGLERE